MSERRSRSLALALILAVALAFRLHNVGFGLPSLYDPDEPIFMIKAFELLANGTLNPKWFGHPGTTTIYLLALIDIAVVRMSLATGAYSSIHEFARAAFADPSLLFLPARIAMALLGVLAVWMTYAVGRRVHGTAVGLIAAGLLALNGVHIAWSQVIRTDIHASVFMLASLLFAVGVAETRRMKDYALAGLFAGFAVATKWPAVTIFAAVLFAGRAFWTDRGRMKRHFKGVIVAGFALIAGLFIASPYIFLDWHTVLANLSNEARPRHLGHTGGGILSNGWWYLWHPVRESTGLLGLLLMVGGCAISGIRSPIARTTVLPAALAFFIIISAEHLIWSRWILPMLPMLMIFAAVAIVALGQAVALELRARRPAVVIGIAALIAAVPSVAGAFAESAERANDTRAQAARWAIAHIAPGNSVVIEHLELSLRDQPWHFRFPLGAAGCVDAVQLLDQGVNYDQVERLRQGSPIVDLGSVNPARLESCQADYAILTYYDLYRAERAAFPKELATYDKILAGGRTIAMFKPRYGHAAGPIVRIVALKKPTWRE